MTEPSKTSGNAGTLTGFLVMSFAVVGLVGLFATFAAPLPLYRLLARDAALDAALEASHAPDPAAALEALRDRLDDSAPALLPPRADMPAAVAAERKAMHTRLLAEAHETAVRLQWLIALMTITAAAFGAAMMRTRQR